MLFNISEALRGFVSSEISEPTKIPGLLSHQFSVKLPSDCWKGQPDSIKSDSTLKYVVAASQGIGKRCLLLLATAPTLATFALISPAALVS